VEQEVHRSYPGQRGEQVEFGKRGGYYDNSGACGLIQNHLLQLMCIIAMNVLPPIKPSSSGIPRQGDEERKALFDAPGV